MTDKLELDIPVLLPGGCPTRPMPVSAASSRRSARNPASSARMSCRRWRLRRQSSASISMAGRCPLPRVREMVRAAGAEISGRYGHATWQVEGIGHERRARTVGETLSRMPGVL